jgi:hypothetical protein
MNNILLSEEWFGKVPDPNIVGINFKKSPLFPFQLSNGNMCHGVLMPAEIETESVGRELFNYKLPEPVGIMLRCTTIGAFNIHHY